MIKVETERSIYFFDEGGRYCRMARAEVERLPFERLQQLLSGGHMDDGVWNDLESVHFVDHPWGRAPGQNPSLNVRYVGCQEGIITTPILETSMADACRLVAQFAAPS